MLVKGPQCLQAPYPNLVEKYLGIKIIGVNRNWKQKYMQVILFIPIWETLCITCITPRHFILDIYHNK